MADKVSNGLVPDAGVHYEDALHGGCDPHNLMCNLKMMEAAELKFITGRISCRSVLLSATI